MDIASGLNNRCVDRAISTCRIVLGMDGKLPVEIPEPRKVETVIEYIGKCFPHNEIFVWCESSQFINAESNVHYCGDVLYFNFDDTKYLSMYVMKKEDSGHMVIGLPAVGYCDIVMTIMIDTQQKTTIGG